VYEIVVEGLNWVMRVTRVGRMVLTCILVNEYWNEECGVRNAEGDANLNVPRDRSGE